MKKSDVAILFFVILAIVSSAYKIGQMCVDSYLNDYAHTVEAVTMQGIKDMCDSKVEWPQLMLAKGEYYYCYPAK